MLDDQIQPEPATAGLGPRLVAADPIDRPPGVLVGSGSEIRVIASPHLRDGEVIIAEGGTMLIGTRPLTPVEAAGREARLIVRRGLADVLTWLGMPVYTDPTSAEIFDSLRRLRD